MIGGGRSIGSILIGVSAVLLIAFVGWLITALGDGETSRSGLALGIVLALAVIAPIMGIGLYLIRKGNSESSQYETVQKQKKLLNMVLTQGKVTIPELSIELELPRNEVEDLIRDLVGKKIFSGAINWEKGILYSAESTSLLEEQTCPNCGGQLTFAGKGLVICPYCGSEVFLTDNAAKRLI